MWYCAYTGVNAELIAFKGLHSKNIEVYLPFSVRIVSHARRQTTKRIPLLSRYLFINFSETDYSDVLDTDGIETILSNNLKPISIPETVIDDLKQRELSGEFNERRPETNKRRWGKSFEILQAILNPPQLTNP